jgi:Uma2 family endonuclease
VGLAREGVSHIWLVDPELRSVEAFRLDADGYRLIATYGESERVRIEPFEAVELELEALWPERGEG